MTLDRSMNGLVATINSRLAATVRAITPADLRAPIAHVVNAGGKRLRPLIALLACESAGGNARDAVDAAVAAEMLHTFTLVHDDIMDNSAMRRGRQTVHTRWDQATAILAGDTIAAVATQSLVKAAHPRTRAMTSRFAQAYLDVCRGQALDRSLGARARVRMPEYLEMIGLKTAAMFAAAAAIGGTVGSGNASRVRALDRFGRELGLAFQIRDDALDIGAHPTKFGKDAGGDIREGKRSFLFVEARTHARTASDRALLAKYAKQGGLHGDDVARLAAFYYRAGVLDAAERAIALRTRAAVRALHALKPSAARSRLESLADAMTGRTF